MSALSLAGVSTGMRASRSVDDRSWIYDSGSIRGAPTMVLMDAPHGQRPAGYGSQGRAVPAMELGELKAFGGGLENHLQSSACPSLGPSPSNGQADKIVLHGPSWRIWRECSLSEVGQIEPARSISPRGSQGSLLESLSWRAAGVDRRCGSIPMAVPVQPGRSRLFCQGPGSRRHLWLWRRYRESSHLIGSGRCIWSSSSPPSWMDLRRSAGGMKSRKICRWRR